MTDKLREVRILVLAPEHLSLTEIAEMFWDKLDRPGSVLTIDAISVSTDTGESPEQDGTDAVAALLHDQMCTQPGCDSRPGHREYYRDRARAIARRLGPEIGAANVPLAVTVILDEAL